MEKLITTHLLAVDQAFVYRWLSGFFVRELEGQVLNAYNTPEGKVLLDQLASDPVLLPLVSAVREVIDDGAIGEGNRLAAAELAEEIGLAKGDAFAGGAVAGDSKL